MWSSFFLENVHFALNSLAALVLFGTGWLYFDAWLERKSFKDGLKVIGFFSLSISFLIHGALLESSILVNPVFSGETGKLLVGGGRVWGYLVLILGLLADPLQPMPDYKGIKRFGGVAGVSLPVFSFSFLYLPILFPILAVIVGLLYLRRASVGLENHLKTVAVVFYILAFYELVSLADLLKETNNVDMYKLVAPFGPIWIVAHLLLLVSVFVLGKWLYSYLLKRFQTQLFMIFTTMVLVVFLLTTVTFTALLLRNLQDETLSRLETDVAVLDFAISSKQGENVSDAQVLAENYQVIEAVEAKDKKFLMDLTLGFLLNKKKSTLVVVSDSGLVLARGEDSERTGDSISDDPLIKRSLLGETASSVVTKDGVLGPEISIRSVVPVKKGEMIIGVVMMGVAIDNAYVDGVKEATGLTASIYGDNALAATTLIAADGKSRYIGIREENFEIKERVLRKGEKYKGAVNLLNTPYFAAYLPLKDVDSNPVGMLFVGKLQVGVLQAASRSIELTFMVAVVLMIMAIFPAYLVSRYIAAQVK